MPLDPYYQHAGITIYHGDVVECDSWMPTNAPAVTAPENTEKMSHSLSAGQSPDSSKAPNTSQSALNGEMTITHGRAMQSPLDRDDQGPSESIPSSEAASSAEPSERSATTSTATRRTTIQVTSPLFAGNATCSQTEDLKNLSNSPSASSRELVLPDGIKPYYNHNGIVIIHGDCREILPTLRGDCIIADPPYGVGKAYGDGSDDTIELFKWAVCMIADSGLPASVCAPVCRLFDVPRRPQWTAVWTKRYGASGLIAYPIYPHWEALLLYNIKGDYAGNNGHRSDVFNFDPEKAAGSGHPTPKPQALMAELIRWFDRDTIIDPFMGSGTTLVAAKNLGRRAIGIEIEEKYCEIAAKRLSQEVFDFS